MKLYGILQDGCKEEKALIEMTQEDLSGLMMIANTAAIYDREHKHDECYNIDSKIWCTLYDIKYSELWNK